MASKLVALSICVGCCAVNALVQAAIAFQGTIYRVDRTTIAKSISEPSIQAFDISPNGALLTLLVRSGSTEKSQLWLLIQEIRTGVVLKRLQIGFLEGKYIRGFSPQIPHVRFTSNGKLLVVQDLQKVQVLETQTYGVVRSIEPPATGTFKLPVSVLGASDGDIFAISYGTGRGPDEAGREIVQVELVDVSNGKRLAKWEAPDIPQSLSPMGKFVAVSDWSSLQSLLPLQIIDAMTGKKVTTLNGGYGLGRVRRDPGVLGNVVGRFFSEDEILLSPGEGWDDSGHYAGKSLKLVRISDGKTLQEFKPQQYGPDNEMAISGNRKAFVAISNYFSPYVQTHDIALPSNYGPQLLMFSFKKAHIELFPKLNFSGLEIYGKAEMMRPCISFDASVIAIATEAGVTIFERPAGL